mgnify:CR=1 FL=1
MTQKYIFFLRLPNFFSKDSQSILGISTLFAQGVVVTSNVESLINLFM